MDMHAHFGLGPGTNMNTLTIALFSANFEEQGVVTYVTCRVESSNQLSF